MAAGWCSPAVRRLHSRDVSLGRCGLERCGARGSGDLRTARRHVYPGRDVRRRRVASGRTPRAGGNRHRVDAGRPVPGESQLGLRRRVSLRRPEQLWRPARIAASGRPGSSGRLGRDPGRRLQPSGPGGKLPGLFRILFHGSLPHPLGRRSQFRRSLVGCRPPVRYRKRADVGPRFPRRRTAFGRGPCDVRLQRAAHPGGAAGKRPADRQRARPDGSCDRREQSERCPADRSAATERLRSGRGVERRFPPQRPHVAHRRFGRLLPGFRTCGALGQSL